ncbi:NAD(+) kinase [Choanephora cucurbitarum]|uniref:NAD(+) kinase n=1 Tax=Choanephora cucurbitarum TaxID=101091 RepID=A0A1C7N7R5_9FUNG|nr:NAD(+) kinase [Choanephora cucurbitarum]
MHRWDSSKNGILIVTKAKDNRLVLFTRQLVEWLLFTPDFVKKFPFAVYVDAHLRISGKFGYDDLTKTSPIWKSQVKFWTPKLCYEQPNLFDLIITLGGDGTLLFAASMFQSKVPPIMPFHLGTFGFLTPFLFTTYQAQLNKLFEGNLETVNRMRICCTVYRLSSSFRVKQQAHDRHTSTIHYRSFNHSTEWEILEFDSPQSGQNDRNHAEKPNNIQYHTVAQEVYHVLNEVVVDRGPSSNMALLELFGDDKHLTTVQADGLCIATATGSTAYSVSIRIAVPFSSRYTAFCSFDGRNRIELKRGDHIKVTASLYSVQTFSCQSVSDDWFNSIQNSLQWNVRPYAETSTGSNNKMANADKTIKQSCSTVSHSTSEESMSEKDHAAISNYRQLCKGSDEESEFDLMPWTEEETQRHTFVTKESKI